jgi:hypothetical protein
MKNCLRNLSNICQFLEEYTKTKSKRNGSRVRYLNSFLIMPRNSQKTHPLISIILVFLVDNVDSRKKRVIL